MTDQENTLNIGLIEACSICCELIQKSNNRIEKLLHAPCLNKHLKDHLITLSHGHYIFEKKKASKNKKLRIWRASRETNNFNNEVVVCVNLDFGAQMNWFFIGLIS